MDEGYETRGLFLSLLLFSTNNTMSILCKPTKTRKRSIYYNYYCCAVILIGCLFLGTVKQGNNMIPEGSKNRTSTVQYQQTEHGQLDGMTGSLFLKYQVLHSSTGEPVSMKQWAESLSSDYESFNTILSSCPFEAFFWECAPTTDGSNRMIFVLVNAPGLAQFARTSPDRYSFREHFALHSEFVAVFPSLGKDALLLAPNPQSPQDFTDIAYFARRASTEQRKAFYQRLSTVLQEQIIHTNRKPLWLSTSGMGIAWMHIRFDSRPKYYIYTPFRNFVFK